MVHRLEFSRTAASVSRDSSPSENRHVLRVSRIESSGQYVDFCCLLLLVLVEAGRKDVLAAKCAFSTSHRNRCCGPAYVADSSVGRLAGTWAESKFPRPLSNIFLGQWHIQFFSQPFHPGVFCRCGRIVELQSAAQLRVGVADGSGSFSSSHLPGRALSHRHSSLDCTCDCLRRTHPVLASARCNHRMPGGKGVTGEGSFVHPLDFRVGRGFPRQYELFIQAEAFLASLARVSLPPADL